MDRAEPWQSDLRANPPDLRAKPHSVARPRPLEETGAWTFSLPEAGCNSNVPNTLRQDSLANPALALNLRPNPYRKRGKAMKRVCAWCGGELDRPDRREDLQATYGVCQVCRRRFFASRKAKEADSGSTREDVGDDSGMAGGQQRRQ
jgi:hypothetical protein